MKKIALLLLAGLLFPIGMMAQGVADDLYFVPSKNKKSTSTSVSRSTPSSSSTTNVYTSPGSTVVVQDRNMSSSNTRDIDEYNRRYTPQYEEDSNDTVYITDSRQSRSSNLDGEWINGEFNGTDSDYELAERIIRFRNPRYAISIGSPIYYDVMYGLNSWDWNVYNDGLYAYAFPTFSNPLWWNWQFNSYSWNWNFGWGPSWGWGRPYWRSEERRVGKEC